MTEIERLRSQFRKVSPTTSKEARRSIAHLASLPTSEVNPREIALLHTGTLSLKDKKRLTDKYGFEDFSHMGQQFYQLGDIFLGGEATRYSYGLCGPSYDAMFRRLPDVARRKREPGKALLAGALTPETIREFSLTIKGVFPNTKAYVIDLINGGKAGEANEFADFVQGNVLRLPFKDDSFDSIHTNILLSHLCSSDTPVFPGDKWQPLNELKQVIRNRKFINPAMRRVAFYKEAYRSLNAEGVLLMVERKGNYIKWIQELDQAGFRHVEFEPAYQFKERAAMNRYYGRGGKYSSHQIIKDPDVWSVIAFK